ncbi:uncharacterized protein LAESUDRAFT_730505 [Laetiporus sulphureus 93-53]|uniref:Uncharacterized protein n=1 Tax=Laetiporus sulphureus 93-53 TaxID=1314785 RepID=A0A165C454_9APHY|nr:uncharacterized protein LAESUDRAFT_730505 [Laetiporus sulphureus 93-53]KZT02172.1 hypothetical protein LAESUDRAFT_730505 [Laetiporus sulphureus 93-53]
MPEIKKILQGLAGLKIVGADIVEVTPGKCLLRMLTSNPNEITHITGANIGWEMLALMAKTPLVA